VKPIKDFQKLKDLITSNRNANESLQAAVCQTLHHANNTDLATLDEVLFRSIAL